MGIAILQHVIEFGQWLINHWTSIFVSTLALIVSVVTLFQTHFKPFTPRIYCTGRYTLSLNPNNPNQYSITFGVIFSNDGVKSGAIQDLIVRVQGTQGRIIDYIAHFETPKQLINFKRDANVELAAYPFESFEIKGKEAVPKQILFIPSDNKSTLPLGKYSVTIYAKSSNIDKYMKFDKLTIEILQEDADKIIPKLPLSEPSYVSINFQHKITDEMKKTQAQFFTDEK